MEEEELGNIMKLLRSEQANEARISFDKISPVNSVEYLLLEGNLEQKFQNWGKALNAFNKVLEIEPENQAAKSHLQLVHNILNFWNPEQFNP